MPVISRYSQIADMQAHVSSHYGRCEMIFLIIYIRSSFCDYEEV